MRRLAFLGLVALLPGCALPCANCSTGYRFEILRPPTVLAPAAVSETSPQLAIAPLAAGVPLAGPAAPAFPAEAVAEPLPAPRRAVSSGLAITSPPSSCTLDDICRKLDRIAARLDTPGKPLP